MSPTQIIIACIVVVCVLFIATRARNWLAHEDFATIKDKAAQLSEWTRAHPNARYTDFIRANPDSNIVEYAKMRALYTAHRLGSRSAVESLRI